MKMKWKIGDVQIDNPFVLAPMLLLNKAIRSIANLKDSQRSLRMWK